MIRVSKFLSSSAALLCRSNASVTRTSSLLFQSPVSSVFVRGFAGEKKKGKKQAAAPVQETVNSDSLIPINIYVGMHLSDSLSGRWKGSRSSPR